MEDLALVLLAAGNSRRFQGNKLLYPLQGKLMYQHMIEQIDMLPRELFSEKIVVTQYHEIGEDLRGRGFRVVENQDSILGISHSIHLALSGLTNEEEAVCFAVCDQPYLTYATIEKLVKRWRQSGKGIGCLCHQGELGNPAIFSGRYKQELLALNGDIGGRRVIRRHLDDLYLCEVDDGKELVDVDIRDGLT